MQRSATPTSTDARVTVQTTPRPSSSAKSRPADSENVAFASLSNAVLELFDKTVETAGVQPSERETLSQQITTRAAEVVETLKIHVRDELQSIRNTELGALKAQERHLMEEVATEQKRVQDLQNQLRALKEALESINKMHAEEMQKRQEEYAVHFKHEIEACRDQHMAEVKRLKAALEASTKGQGSTFPRGLEVDKLALHYAQTEAFHAAQVSKLQSEADAHRAVGNVKEADVRLDYLQYHRAELEKTRAVLHLTKDKSMLLEDAVKALQAQYAVELEESQKKYAEKVFQERAAMQKELGEELDRLRKELAASQGELADKRQRLDLADRGAAELDAIKAEHSVVLSSLKEQHREEVYKLKAKQARLQKELSLRMDPLQISSQDSGISLGSTAKRRMGSSPGHTGSRRTQETSTPKKLDPRGLEEQELGATAGQPQRDVKWWAAQEHLMGQLDDLDEHYEDMQAKRGRLEDYDA